MTHFGSLCDDFYINMNLSTEMDLPTNRETVLHYFERVQKKFPEMRNFFGREKGDYVLEEDKDKGNYRWAAIEFRRLSSGVVNPATIEAAMEQHHLVLDVAPAYLSVSPLDCEALDLMYGFDFTYRGNHNQLVAEALGLSPAFERFLDIPGATSVNHEPSITLALDETCRLLCRISVETRTNAVQARTGEFPEEQISVYFTARHFGSLGPETNFQQTLDRLAKVCTDMVDSYVVESVLQPLARAIAAK